MRYDGLDINVDRHGMFKLQEIGEPQRRRTRAGAGLRGRKGGKLGIRRRQHDYVAGRLAQIDRF